jgi:hypothetical protein
MSATAIRTIRGAREGREISQRKTNKVWDGVGLTQVFGERG